MTEEEKSYWFQDFIRDKIKSVKPQLLEKLDQGKDHSIHNASKTIKVYHEKVE